MFSQYIARIYGRKNVQGVVRIKNNLSTSICGSLLKCLVLFNYHDSDCLTYTITGVCGPKEQDSTFLSDFFLWLTIITNIIF